MAQFKFIGHSNGAAPEHAADKPVQIKGKCKPFQAQNYELEVLPNEVFEIADDWTLAIQSLENTSRNDQPMYERVS